MKTGFCRGISLNILFFLFLLFAAQNLLAQTQLSGKVTYGSEDAPAAFASIEFVNDKDVKSMTDNAGNFHVTIKESHKKDSLLISSVGYKTLRIPVTAAMGKKVFNLSESVKSIEGVTVFSSHNVIGSVSESVGYYRSWSDHTGGEIGRVFSLPYKKFKIDKIRFKAGNTCDTCVLRLHVRKFEDGVPGEEVFRDSVGVMVSRLSLDSKISEFDLTPFDFTFTEKEFFVGLEVLNCGNGKKGSCAFNFAGTEKGEYLFKSTADGAWQKTDDYTIYLKLFLRY